MSVQQSSDVLLLNLDKHTNLSTPYSKYVQRNIFPEQDLDKLNKEFTLYYRDRRITELNYTIKTRPRPSDDAPKKDYIPDRPENYEENDIQHGLFKFIRFDKSEPYKFVAISDNYIHVLVGSTKSDPIAQTLISTKQFKNYLGIIGFDQYFSDLENTKSITLAVDNIEPLHSVLVEYLDDKTYRIVLGEECQTKLYNYYHEDLINLSEKELKIYKVDPIYYNRYSDDNEIANLRKKILSGRNPYESKINND